MGRLTSDIEAVWQQLAAEVMSGFKEWRLQHPRATLKEMEAALDERWAKARARALQDAALASAAADVSVAQEAERPCCPQCGAVLQARGQARRTLTTTGDQPITLTRSYAQCPACGAGLFPPGCGTGPGARDVDA